MGYLAHVVLSVLCANILLHILQCECQSMRMEALMSVPKLITAAGYPSEKHRVLTEDGYSLQMHRIPAGRRTARRSEPKGKKAVLIMHGLLSSSGDFVISGPERGLPFLLADAGYDVWLGNFRGNLYTTHQNLSRSDPKFWEYSFHEHGKYDNPAMIDYILNATGLPKVLYIGYSMGTTSFFTMLAERPEYNDKIVSFVALAPAVYLDNIKSIATMILKTLDLTNTMRSDGMISVYLQPRLTDFILANFCPVKNLIDGMCIPLINSLVGQDDEQADWEVIKLAIARLQPASWRQLEHFGKVAITGVFTSWEDGLWGEVKPYNLTNVRVPVTLLYGENDQLTEKSQIMKLAAELKKNGMLEEVRPGCSWPKFNHLDFVFAKDLADLLNKPLVKYVDKMYNKYG